MGLGDKMKAKYCALFHLPNGNGTQVCGLSESQLISTLMDRGFHTLSSVSYDDQRPGTVRPVEGKEMSAIWKQVYKAILERRQGK
jgi:hypothetical protein